MNENTKTAIAVATVAVATVYAVHGLYSAGKLVFKENRAKKELAKNA